MLLKLAERCHVEYNCVDRHHFRRAVVRTVHKAPKPVVLAFICAFVASGEAFAEADKPTGLTLTQLEMDRVAAQASAREDLLDARRVCEKSNQDLSICRANIEEAVRRDAFFDLYATRSREGAGLTTWQNVLQAAFSNANEYHNPVHGMMKLNCRLAYDAGIGWGFGNPSEAVVPHVTDAEIDATAEGCFSTGGTTLPLQGLLAGMRHGQAYFASTTRK